MFLREISLGLRVGFKKTDVFFVYALDLSIPASFIAVSLKQ
jgi:hypothetical protein